MSSGLEALQVEACARATSVLVTLEACMALLTRYAARSGGSLLQEELRRIIFGKVAAYLTFLVVGFVI